MFGWPPVQLIDKPYLVQRLLDTGWWGQIIRQLAVEGALDLMLAHWLVALGSRRFWGWYLFTSG